MVEKDHIKWHVCVEGDEVFPWKKDFSGTSSKRHVETNYKINSSTDNDKVA
jgi:hypothetical protein